MKRWIIIIVTVVSILPLSGCWRYYHGHSNNGQHYDNDHHNGNNRGNHHMWN